MIIKILVENTAKSDDFKSEHGLSLYIEANTKKILFDVGTTDLFFYNAKKLNVNISEIDYLIISHGHYDHGGGLSKFLENNKRAKIFIHEEAFNDYYALRLNGNLEYIGLNKSLKDNKQIILISDNFLIDENLEIFSNILKKFPMPNANKGLMLKSQENLIEDEFGHEQNLIIKENDKIILITGCAHNGIMNILNHFYDFKKKFPDWLIGGFHLSSKTFGNESDEKIEKIGTYLKKTKSKYYTCHCTGLDPYNKLKKLLNENIDYLMSGSILEI